MMDINVIKRKMLVKYPFFGSVVASVGYKEEKSIPTAATDGEIIYYNSKFLEELCIEEQVFIFAHEVCHIAFNHILRSEGKIQELWDIATDAVINQFLMRDGLMMVKGGVDIPEAINYDAETLYEKLLKERKQQQQSGASDESSHEQNESSQNKEQRNVGHDSHSMWEQAVKRHKERQDTANKQGDLLDKPFEKDKGIDEKETFNKNIEQRKKQLEELKEAISRQALHAGTSTNEEIRTVSDIGHSKPIIDWRYVLREAIKFDVDWSYQNATIEDGVVIAHLEEQPIPETEIVIDTSGSINDTLLKNFLRECKNILQKSRLKVGCFDTKFYGFHEIRTEEDIDNLKYIGSGGTNFNAAINAFSNRVENKIIFTDGEASMPQKELDVIWIVFGNERINPKGGRVIYITGEQLERLYSFKTENETKCLSKKLDF